MNRSIVATVTALLFAMAAFGTAVGQQPPQQTSFNVPFRGVAAPGSTFDLVQGIIDFNAGAKASTNTASVPNYLTVLEGELTVQIGDKSESVARGKGVAVPAGAALTMSNTSTARARIFVSALLPVGAVASVPQPNSSGVTLVSLARRTISNAPATVDIIQVSTQYDAGFKTGNHVMNELHLFSMLSGATDFGYLDHTAVDTFRAGQQAVMHEGMAGWMANSGTEKSSFVLTWVATPGKPLTSAVAAPTGATTPAAVAPGAPRTGDGAMPIAQPGLAAPGSVLVSAGLAVLICSAAGALLYSWSRRSN
ncbi:MAG: cupin domain-containing protein [Tepidiformaceae bacterium]